MEPCHRQVHIHSAPPYRYIIFLFNAVSGEANFSIARTALTVGGFTQPQVAKALIEQPPDKGLAQRFLWIIPCPTYSKFETLEAPDEDFIQYMSMQINGSI